MNVFVQAKPDFAVFFLQLSILISSIPIKFVLHVEAISLGHLRSVTAGKIASHKFFLSITSGN